MLALQLGWGIWLFASSFYDSPVMMALVDEKYSGTLNYRGWQASLLLYLILLAAAVLMLGELLSFHVVLIHKVRLGQRAARHPNACAPCMNLTCSACSCKVPMLGSQICWNA